MAELKRCPFCGGDVSIVRGDNCWFITRGKDKAVSCDCRLFMESDAFHKDDVVARREAKENLIKKWNTRNPWHTGTPTEEGFWLVKYQCVVEGKYKGILTYRAVKIEKDKIDGFPYESGSIGRDDVWKPIEYQKIDDLWNGEVTNG